MNREEALQHFNENFVRQKSIEKMLKVEEFFHKNRDNLVADFLDSFRRICLKIKQIQNEGKKGEVGYITFSLLRTSMKEGKLLYLIEAFDSNWFLDRMECQAIYDAGWLGKFLDEFEAELEENRREYVGLLGSFDTERLKFKEAGFYSQYIANIARYTMPFAVLLREYRDIVRNEKMEVRVGEYLDISEVVYKENSGKRNPEEITRQLLDMKDKLFWHEDFKKLNLSKGNLEKRSLNHSDFKGSDLSESNMKFCKLIGTRFHECIMIRADLSNSYIYDADFSDCNLDSARFVNSKGAKGRFYNPKFRTRSIWGVNFERANLENVSFKGADLQGANFKGAKFKNVDFSGANLHNALFLRKDVEALQLDDIQRESIIWE
ncbi:MAG TPA: pentapeptide repeat-containing protein [Pseudobacteroides sp.]|nr:pentapeptide repeat-containing protein [Pseudobacteroides sp.]